MLLLSLTGAVGVLLLLSSSLGFEVESSVILSVFSRLLCFLRLKSIGLEGDCASSETTSFSFCNPELLGLLLRLVDLGKCLGFGLGFVCLILDVISLASFWASRVFCLATISLSFWLMDSSLLSVKRKNIATISQTK